MKTSKLQNFAWAFIALVLTSTTVYSQGWRNGNQNFQNQKGTCLEQISDLSEKQKTQISELEENHQKAISELRNSRRSTTDVIEKNEIRGEMLKAVDKHQNTVKNLLNEEQQKQYALLHTTANPNYAQRRLLNGTGARNNPTFVRGAARGNNNTTYNRGGNRGSVNNKAFVQGAGRGNCYATVGKGNARGAGSNQNFVRGNGKGNYAMANNAGFNRGRANRQGNVGTARYGQGNGRNAVSGRGYGRRFNTIPTDTIEDSKEN